MIMHKYKYFKNVLKILVMSFIAVLFIFGSKISHADEIADSPNSTFDFKAFIKDSDVIDGTPDWDKNDESGNDSGPKNGIVRTFDTVTYPLKVTINPKNNQTLKNIELKISGKLHDGFKDGHAVGRFAIGNQTKMKDPKNGDVTFSQDYTMESSGNAVMIPVTVEVQGAKPNQEIYPDYIKVEVVSVDGKAVKDVSVTFNNLKRIKVSAKVNVGVSVRSGFTNINNRVYYRKFDVNAPKDDERIMHQMYFSLNAIPLSGRTSLKGSTFPSGKIKFHIDSYGDVTFDGHEDLNRSLKQEELPHFFDHFAFYEQDYRNIIPQPNTWAKEHLDKYNLIDYRGTVYFDLAKSSIPNYLDKTQVEKESYRSVWDSGVYKTEQPSMDDKTMKISGEVSDYVIGSTFPEYRADGWTGWKTYSANEKAFSTHSFLFLSENLFERQSESNPNELSNTVNYRFKITVDSYFDDEGNEIPLNAVGYATSTERNEFGSGYDIVSRFFAEDGSLIGSPHLSWNIIPEGDDAVFEGTNAVRFVFEHVSNVRCRGGMQKFVKWNVDSFEMTRELAIRSRNNIRAYKDFDWNWRALPDEKIKFGIPKHNDMSFKTLGGYGKEDYDWYSNLDEALSKGKIGAILADINDDLYRNQWAGQSTILLKPISHKIGSENEKGTHNVAMFEPYFYPDKERKVEHHVKEGYVNPTIYNEDGSIQKLQNPVSGTVGFDTLGVLNAKTTVSVKPDKDSYYLSENQNWDLNTSITFATGMENSLRNHSVTLKAYLSKALSYKKQSAFYEKDGKKVYVEPKIDLDKNGNQILSWDYLLSNDIKVPTIHFKTEVIPLKLDSGVIVPQSIKAVIESDIDKRKEALRTGTKDITVLKIGQVGVAESIEKEFGDKNSDYTLHLQPYTTIEDEKGIKGLTHVPKNGDKYGSKFNGLTYLKDVSIKGSKTINVFVNTQYVEVNNPNSIDVSTNDWMSFEEAKSKKLLNQIQSIYFVIPDILTNKDKALIDLTFGTKNNQFNDIYYNEVLVNSDTNYPLSLISNRVSYKIKAQLELGLRKIQIYTDLSTKGLPVTLYLNKEIVQESGKNHSFDISIYDKNLNQKVWSKTYTGESDISVIKTIIPPEVLTKNTHHTYEAVIENYDDSKIFVEESKQKLATDGYTSSEETVSANDNTDTNLVYKGVIETEREVGSDMVKFFETVEIPIKKINKTKSGYGIELNNYKVSYINELSMEQSFDTELLVPKNLIDKTVDLPLVEGDYKQIALNKTVSDTESKTNEFKYELPTMWIRQKDGSVYLPKDKEKAIGEFNGKYKLLNGGKKLYVPIWISELGDYQIKFQNSSKVGVNAINFSIINNVKVYAYMYATKDSATIKDDELLLEPVYPSSTNPKGWNEDEVNWLKR